MITRQFAVVTDSAADCETSAVLPNSDHVTTGIEHRGGCLH